MLKHFEVGKFTLHYIVPNLCDKLPPPKSRAVFDELIDRLVEIDSNYLFQEIVARLKQKNPVFVLHNLEIINRVVADSSLLTSEVLPAHPEL